MAIIRKSIYDYELKFGLHLCTVKNRTEFPPIKTIPTILAIESSCDDTSAAIWANNRLLSNELHSQSEHVSTGGVVPEVASRAHQAAIIRVIKKSLQKAEKKIDDIDAIAVTFGPGLMGSLVVGTAFAKAFAAGLNVPLIPIHHMEAHVLCHFATDKRPEFPFLCLTVSGGHTQLLRVDSPFKYTQLGATIDDAAGEAFDKSGKLLGLPYPAGPHIDRLAKDGNARFAFAKPKLDGLNFTYSGLKTSILYFLKDQLKSNPNFINDNINDLCASVQKAIIDSLIIRLEKAIQQTGLKQVALAGGVSANSELRIRAKQLADKMNCSLYVPPISLSTDNAGMIAAAAHFAYKEQRFADDYLEPQPRVAMSCK